MKKILFILISVLAFASCQDKATIQVRNMLSKAVINNVEWGGIPIGSQLSPGQASTKITVSENDSYYDIKFPESNQVKFYIDVNGDKVYVQTRAFFKLDANEDLVIVIADSTSVFNPLLESQK